MKIILFFTSFVVFVSCSSNSLVQEQEFGQKDEEKKKEIWQWTYEGDKGPDNWASLNPQYEMCKSGKLQSPINLVWHKPTSPSPLTVSYKEGDATVTNAGYTFRLEMTPQSQIKINNQEYLLEKIEFRTPSEHRLSGNALPAELQFYHRSPNGLKQAIISMFVIVGRESEWFNSIWETAAKTPLYKTSSTFRFNPSILIPPRKTFYHYKGSLSHPPCLEGVQWIVFNTPLQLSKKQLSTLRSVYNNNNRPVQNINNRDVTNY